jgi:quinol monooxygenase YgiN
MPTMFTLPWRWTRSPRRDRSVVFVSRFDAKGLRARWVLIAAGVRLRRAVLASPGVLGVSLRAHVIAGHFYTLSMWEDEASLLAFARGAAHRAAVRRISALGPVSGVLISREDDGARPRWGDILHWVAAAEPGPYRMAPKPAPV